VETTFKKRLRPTSSVSRVVLCGGLTSLIKSRLRHPGRGRLPARVRLFRVPARGEAHSRPHYEHGITGNAVLDLDHGRVRRHERVAQAHQRLGPGEMKQILADIQSGAFAQEWVKENRDGLPNYHRLQKEGPRAPRRKAWARQLRSMMPLLASGSPRPQDVSGG